MSQSYPEDKYKNIRYFIGDVRDKNRMIRACANVDIIIHGSNETFHYLNIIPLNVYLQIFKVQKI